GDGTIPDGKGHGAVPVRCEEASSETSSDPSHRGPVLPACSEALVSGQLPEHARILGPRVGELADELAGNRTTVDCRVAVVAVDRGQDACRAPDTVGVRQCGYIQVVTHLVALDE